MELTKKIQIIINEDVETNKGTFPFQDALYFDEDSVPTEIELETIAQERIDLYKDAIENPVEE
jgi:hypothetical protein